MSSDRFQEEGLVLIKLPQKFVRHWQDEAMRLRDLTEVLYRSLAAEVFGRNSSPQNTSIRNTGLRGDPRGDDTLAKHIDGSLEALWVEIEQVAEGFWERRGWEQEEDE